MSTTGPNAKSPPCLVCKNKITKSQSCVMCHVCQRWTHPECSKIAPELLKYLIKENRQGTSISWSCEACSVASEILNNKIAALHRELEDVKQDISGLKQDKIEMTDNISEVRGLCDENKQKLSEMKDNVERTVFLEMRDREEKKVNFLVQGVPEVEDDNLKGYEKKEIDMNWIGEIAESINVQIDLDKDIKFVRRLGEKKTNAIRPLLVGCYEQGTKIAMLKNCKELKQQEEWNGVYLVPDLTWQQRKEEEDLASEMHKKNSELTDEQKDLNLEWRLVGPKGEKRLVLGKKIVETDRRWREGWRGRGRGGGGGQKRGRTPENNHVGKRTRPSVVEEED